jgi:hypothetical protein
MSLLNDICKEIERKKADNPECGTALVISEKAYAQLKNECITDDNKAKYLDESLSEIFIQDLDGDYLEWIVENWEWT